MAEQIPYVVVVNIIYKLGSLAFRKTALAQLIYHDTGAKGYFKKMMWVCVSEDFEPKTILKKMLKSLEVKEAIDGFELDQLQKKLHEELSGQNYMLVLDDIWNENPLKWDALRKYLMCGCQRSKILLQRSVQEFHLQSRQWEGFYDLIIKTPNGREF
ncbi:hypothetical protein PIB30_034599 [Stylosanthes scabra]|uniref:NB-ARC domain-containing protein n=1 Tax=Stylosanthes scabra TaxID=79078 RepID=A0ABU6VF11_9FABA|nr:hypothetical protein [Stylosanthes scabra]